MPELDGVPGMDIFGYKCRIEDRNVWDNRGPCADAENDVARVGEDVDVWGIGAGKSFAADDVSGVAGLQRAEYRAKSGLAAPVFTEDECVALQLHVAARVAITEPADVLDADEFPEHGWDPFSDFTRMEGNKPLLPNDESAGKMKQRNAAQALCDQANAASAPMSMRATE
jgi:hypothetical protein